MVPHVRRLRGDPTGYAVPAEVPEHPGRAQLRSGDGQVPDWTCHRAPGGRTDGTGLRGPVSVALPTADRPADNPSIRDRSFPGRKAVDVALGRLPYHGDPTLTLKVLMDQRAEDRSVIEQLISSDGAGRDDQDPEPED